jgi:hypothetical protein
MNIPNIVDDGGQTYISYNYPPTFATKLQPSYTGYIHYSFVGKENEPNITIQTELSSPIHYVSKELYIFSKIHNFPNIPPFDGELVITHEPITNTNNKPVYMCFPLKTDYSQTREATAPGGVIQTLLETEDDTNKNMNIDIISILNPTLRGGASLAAGGSATSYYYETPYAIVVVAQTPIPVSSNFVGFNRGKIDDLWEIPKEIKRANLRYKFDEEKPRPFFWVSPSPSSAAASKQKENFTDAMCDGSYCFFDCDFIDPGYENEVPTYMIRAGSDTVSPKEELLNYIITVIWTIVMIILVCWLAPLLFSILAVRLLKTTNHDDNLNILNDLEATISYILLIPGAVLTGVGIHKNRNCKKDDDACSETANQLIVSGSIILGVWFFYLIAMFTSKVYMSDFIGYSDYPAKTTPFFIYQKGDIRIIHILDFTRIFSTLSKLFRG